MTYIIYNKSSENMSEVPNGLVKMILTSPESILNPDDMSSIFKECYRVLRDDGVFFFLVGHPFNLNKEENEVFVGKGKYPFHFMDTILKHTDFIMSEDIIIVKRSQLQMGKIENVSNLTSNIHSAYDTDSVLDVHQLVIPQHEHLFMFTKTADYRFNLVVPDVWFEPKMPDYQWAKEGIPTPFIEDTVTLCIRLTTVEGDAVLDPMAGSCTLGVVAERMNRHSILYELDDSLCELGEKRILGEV